MPLLQRKFTDRHPLACKDVGVLDILNKPTGLGQKLINFFAGVNFTGHLPSHYNYTNTGTQYLITVKQIKIPLNV